MTPFSVGPAGDRAVRPRCIEPRADTTGILTTNPPVPLLRSISGRLYAAIGVLCVALLATNAQTIIYSGTVAAGADAVEQESIDAMRAVDGFDELLDQYRRAVTVNTGARAQ
jgi:hypothetical protein